MSAAECTHVVWSLGPLASAITCDAFGLHFLLRPCLPLPQGGFHLIGSGRDKIETEEQLAAAVATCQDLQARPVDGRVCRGEQSAKAGRERDG